MPLSPSDNIEVTGRVVGGMRQGCWVVELPNGHRAVATSRMSIAELEPSRTQEKKVTLRANSILHGQSVVIRFSPCNLEKGWIVAESLGGTK